MAVVWDGELDTNMLSGVNWNANVTPSLIDDVVIDGGGGVVQPILDSTAVFGSVAISAGNLTVLGDLLTFGGVTISGTGRMSIGLGGSLTGNLTVSASLTNMVNIGTISGNVVYSGLGSRFTNEGVVTGSVTFLSGGVYESSVSGIANVIGSASTESAVLTRTAFTIAFAIDVSDGGAGRNIGDGTRLTDFDVLDVRGGSAADRFTGGGLLDNLFGNGGNDTLSGNAGADRLNGGLDNDQLDGGTGADSMDGGAGNDLYLVDNVGDVVTDSSGLDTITTTLSRYNLGGTGVETLIFAGTGSGNMAGNDLDNTLIGSALNDRLDGKGGGDQMIGLSGNDVYTVSSFLDVIEEAPDGGVDTVQRGNGDIILFDFQNVENARLLGIGAFGLFGDDAANRLTGNSADNVISGGMGADVLLGGKGFDLFRFSGTGQSQAGLRDRIMDFAQDEDLIDLLRIDARVDDARNNAFVWIDDAKFSGAGAASQGELRYVQQGEFTVVQGDTDGDGSADIMISLLGTFNLSDADFIL